MQGRSQSVVASGIQSGGLEVEGLGGRGKQLGGEGEQPSPGIPGKVQSAQKSGQTPTLLLLSHSTNNTSRALIEKKEKHKFYCICCVPTILQGAVQFSYFSAMTGQREKEAEEEEEEEKLEEEEGRSQKEGVVRGKERVVEVTKVNPR